MTTDHSSGRGVNIICDSSSSMGSIARDSCGRLCYDNSGSSSHHTISGRDSGSHGGSAVDSTSTPTSGTGYSNSGFVKRGGGNSNGAGITISCDSLSSLELEMTYDPHGCIYGPEGRLTPDSTWKKHLEFLAHVPEY